MFSAFQRPQGASADVKELEYISALLQSQVSEIRSNGTISATDIQLFMKSRYALDITDDERLDILRGLGGGAATASTSTAAAVACTDSDDDSEVSSRPDVNPNPAKVNDSFHDNQNEDEHQQQEGEEYLDLVQLVSILIIPTILKASHDVISLQTTGLDIHKEMEASIQYAQQQIQSTYNDSDDQAAILTYRQKRTKRKVWENKIKEIEHAKEHQPNPRFIIRYVLRILIGSLVNNSVAGTFIQQQQQQQQQDDDDPLPPFKLTIQSLKTLLQTHGEYAMANNTPLLKAMIAACSSSSASTTPETKEGEMILDEVAFANALSSDLHLWNIGCEDNVTTTTYHDVFHFDHIDDFDDDVIQKVPILQNLRLSTNNLRDYIVGDNNNNDGLDKSFQDDVEDENEKEKMVKFSSSTSFKTKSVDIEAPFIKGSRQGSNTAKSTLNSDQSHDLKKDGDEDEDVFFDAMANDSHQISSSDLQLDTFVSCNDIKLEDENNSDDNSDNDQQGKKTVSESVSSNKEKEITSVKEKPKHVRSAPFIDYVVDSYRSLPYLMSLWIFYLFSVVLAMNFLAQAEGHNLTCETPSFSCNLVQDLLVWVIIAVTLSVGGMLIIVPISFPNDPSKKSPYTIVFSFVLLTIYTFWPYVFIMDYREGIPHSEDGKLSNFETYIQSDTALLITRCFLVFGCILLFKILLLFINAVIPYKSTINNPTLNWYMLPSHSTSTANVKLAATHKVNVLLQNAIKMHHPIESTQKNRSSSSSSSNEDIIRRRPVNAMQNFVFHGEYHEQCGGFFWAWKRVLNKDLTRKDGIWLHSRLAVGQEGQAIILAVFMVLIFWGADTLAEDARNFRAEIIADRRTPLSYKQWALNVVPEPWMIYAAFIPGGCIAFASGVLVILVYVPSTITTVLKLRSGVIQTLRSKNFKTFRASADSIYYNTGNMVYALIGSVGLMFVIFAGVIFLFVWPVTKEFMVLVLSWGLGLSITIGIKTVLLMLCRANFQSAFFRRYPRRANFSSLAMECWNIGIGGGAMIGRLTQFLLASAFWIGRVDVTFLDENVNMFGYGFDYAPKYYRQEILVHEAHRHPFIERLGAMYLMRLKHGKNFASDVGACWRILFVKALMPWLEKYRGCSVNEENNV